MFQDFFFSFVHFEKILHVFFQSKSVTNSLNFIWSQNGLIFFIPAGYFFLDLRFWIDHSFLLAFENDTYFLLVFMISGQKSAVIQILLIFFFLQVSHYFSLAVFKIFSLSLIFRSSIILSWHSFFEFILFMVHVAF